MPAAATTHECVLQALLRTDNYLVRPICALELPILLRSLVDHSNEIKFTYVVAVHTNNCSKSTRINIETTYLLFPPVLH